MLYYEMLTEENFLIYAAHNYKNASCTGTQEFLEDVKKIKYIKKLVTRYETTGELKERLILNHIIVLGNVFDPEVLCRILFLKMEPQFGYIKPFLLTISMLTDKIVNVRKERIVDTANIVMDQHIVEKLRELLPRSIQYD